jgi:hypothetical protein
VTDKAEKVHARANDLYTAGQNRQHQSPELEDKTHYGDSDLEAGKDPGSSISLAPGINTPPITCVPLQHSEKDCRINLPLRSRPPISFTVGPSSSDSTPPRNEKPVVVDAKRVLGLDDASYLDASPSQNGEHSMGTAEEDGTKEMTGQGSSATVAPASLPVEDTSLGVPKPSSSLRSKTWANATFGPSNIYRASEVDAKHDCMTTLDGSEIKYRRVSELTGFESPRSPTHSTGYSGSNRSTIPPFEMSAESTPAVLFSNRHSTSDCFDVGKTRPSGATRERGTGKAWKLVPAPRFKVATTTVLTHGMWSIILIRSFSPICSPSTFQIPQNPRPHTLQEEIRMSERIRRW